MKIGILFDDAGFQNIDFRYPENGNPGIGGTQFCFLMLIRYYSKINKTDELIVYHLNSNDSNKYWENITLKHTSLEDFSLECKKDNIDIALISISRLKILENQLSLNCIKTIVWAHNFLTQELLNLTRKSEIVKRIVFVGKEQYDRYIDDDIINKSVCIMNIFNANCPEYQRESQLKNIVTYTGAIVKGKGFHVLAREWTNILKEVPDAELYVLGTGNLYGGNIKMGKYGIASEEYEKEFIPYLLDSEGKILPSIHFMGILGKEKNKIYQKTKVGIINPTARTEICSISAIEMEACGIPVVSKFHNGMPDVIENKQTGLLPKNKKSFRKNVIKLLKDNQLNILYSKQAKTYVNKKFNPHLGIKLWEKTFNDVHNDILPTYNPPQKNYTNNFKFARVINRFLRYQLGLRFLPSLACLEWKIVKLLNRK